MKSKQPILPYSSIVQVSDSNSESDDDMPKMPTVKPNPFASKLPFDHLSIQRTKVKTRDKSSSNEPSRGQEPEGEIIS